jgi:hypothetical protein
LITAVTRYHQGKNEFASSMCGGPAAEPAAGSHPEKRGGGCEFCLHAIGCHTGVAGGFAGRNPLAGSDVKGEQLELIGTIAAGTAARFGFEVRKAAGQETIIGYDVAGGYLSGEKSVGFR